MIAWKIEMNILLLYNNFDGAHGSLAAFQREILQSTKEIGSIFVSASAEQTLEICRKYKVDFSLGIGAFNQFINGIPVYEVTGVHHYQWLIDNPLKMNIDTLSSRITYILIDRDFIYNLGSVENSPLFMPLGITEEVLSEIHRDKTEGIVFSGQIKNSYEQYEALNSVFHDKRVRKFVDEYEGSLKDSFERKFYDHFGGLPVKEQKEIFRPLNTYFRTIKRKEVLESIRDYPIYIIGEIYDEELCSKSNIHILSEAPYDVTWETISLYRYSLNINPNFHDGLHDRIIRSICCGTIPVTEDSAWCREIFGKKILYYDFADMHIEQDIAAFGETTYLDLIHELRQMTKNFTWSSLIKKIEESLI